MIKEKLHILIINSFIIFIFYYHSYLIQENYFIYSGDTHEVFITDNYYNLFRIYVDRNFGSFNGYDISLHFIDNLLFFITQGFYNIYDYQKFRYILSFLIVLNGCYFILLYFKLNSPVLGTLFLTFNTYVISLTSGGVFNYTFAFSYIASLYIFLAYVYFLIYDKQYKLKLIVLFLFLSFLTIWLHFTLIFSLFFVTLLNLKYFNLVKLKYIAKCTLKYIVISSPFIFSIIVERYFNSEFLNDISVSSMGNIHFNFLNQFKLFFSWPIYNIWFPRYHYSYGEYFSSIFYNIGIFFLWASILIVSYINKKNKLIITIIAILLLSFFLSRGPQPPTGSIFLFLYENFSIFQIFRTPDIRFGFIVIICLGVIISLNNNIFIKKIFLISIILISYPLFIGDVLIGKNIENKYFDRVNKLSIEHFELQEFVNNLSFNLDYITDPPQDYGTFKYNSEIFTGPDILPLLLNKNYITNTKSGKINKKYLGINFCNESVNYIILRNDIEAPLKCNYENKTKIFTTSNNLFTVYINNINNNFSLYSIDDFFIFRSFKFQNDGNHLLNYEFGNIFYDSNFNKINSLEKYSIIEVKKSDKIFHFNILNLIFIVLLILAILTYKYA